jgi:hypothetical protein
MKFSELLGEPEPEPGQEPERTRERERELPAESEPISVFAPVPVATPPATTSIAYPSAPPEPVAPRPAVAQEPPLEPRDPVVAPVTPDVAAARRSGLAELNVRQEAPAPAEVAPEADELGYLEAVVDDLLPSTRRGRR